MLPTCYGSTAGRTGQLLCSAQTQRLLSNHAASTRCSDPFVAARAASSARGSSVCASAPLASSFASSACFTRATPTTASFSCFSSCSSSGSVWASPASTCLMMPSASLHAHAQARRLASRASQQQAQQETAEAAAAAAAAEQQEETAGQQGAARAQRPQPKYSPLHMNIEEFSKKICPTEDEKKTKEDVIEGVRLSTNKAFPDLRGRVKVEVFGSFANGMSTWHSDVDLVVTGMFEPDRVTGCYDLKDRGRVTARLRKIADQLRRFKKLDIARLGIIGRARIPIIKMRTRNNVSVDISISDSSGIQAARYMVHQARLFPPMRALTLVLKAYLKAQRLNDVATGGLSSYSLCNMVVAHLQEELKSGREIHDLGETLYSFFLRYGEEFDYSTEAVSVRSGGVVPKRSLPFSSDAARFASAAQAGFDGSVAMSDRLCVDCPLSGRDVSNGTYRIDMVRQAFYRASRQLEALARGRSIDDTTINYLSALFDVQRVVKRIHVDEDPHFKTVGGPASDDDIMTGRGPARWGGGRRFDAPPGFGDSFDDEGEDFELDMDDSGGDDDTGLGSDAADVEAPPAGPPKGGKGKGGRGR